MTEGITHLHQAPARQSASVMERRVAQGQVRMQTVSDPFLGWTTSAGRHYLIRQLVNQKASIDPE